MHAGIFGAAYIRFATMQKAVSGFRATGIFPFNPDVYSDDDFAPSLATEQPFASPAPTSVTRIKLSSAPTTPLPTEPSSALLSQRVSVTHISPLPQGREKHRRQRYLRHHHSSDSF